MVYGKIKSLMYLGSAFKLGVILNVVIFVYFKNMAA